MSRGGCFRLALLLICPLAWAADSQPPAAGGPAPETVRAFDAYARLTESRMDALAQKQDGFLWADTPDRRSKVRQAGVVCEPRNNQATVRVAGGLLHDWVGAAFIPGATVDQVLRLSQDYNNHRNTYHPDVLDSRTLERHGDDFKVRLRLFKRKVVTVVLDTDYDIHYRRLGGRDWQSRSYSTRIVEIADAGSPRERQLGPREDHGYLWRINSYWFFREKDGGVYVECEAVSLSRGVPAVLAWLIDPIIRSLPKDALENTLRSTRAMVLRTLAN
jgi:hypothetical protein